MIISIPTGAKIFNWLFTMYRGRIRFELPMMWLVAFMLTFVIGGMTGVLLAVPPADFVLHNSLFLIAHFHNVIIGGVLFGLFAAINFWWPKAFGFKLDKFWGMVSFCCWAEMMALAAVIFPSKTSFCAASSPLAVIKAALSSVLLPLAIKLPIAVIFAARGASEADTSLPSTAIVRMLAAFKIGATAVSAATTSAWFFLKLSGLLAIKLFRFA
jgi:hypothetical protein